MSLEERIMEHEGFVPKIYKDTYFTKGLCPIAEEIQPRLMVFKTNYRDLKIAKSNNKLGAPKPLRLS